MCPSCQSINKHFIVKHEESACPFVASLYCPTCASYGHQCPGRRDLRPDPALLKEFLKKPVSPSKPILELTDREDSLKSFLQSKSRMPNKALKRKDLQKLVTAYAKEMGMELSLITR
jgi:hypothetical protein